MGPTERTVAALEEELQPLRQSEQLHGAVLTTMGVIAYQRNPGAPPHWLVGAVADITGHAASDFVSGTLRWEALIHPDDLSAVRHSDETLRDAAGPVVREYRVRHARGDIRWVEERVQSQRGPAGEITRIQGTIREITLQKRAEADPRADRDVRASEAKYRNLVEQVPAIVYTSALDEFSATTYASPQVERILGYPQDVYQGDPFLWKNCLHPDDRERVLAELARSQAASAPFVSEYRCLTRDGRVVWLHDEGTIVRDDQGRPLCLQGVMFDVTERKRAEADREQLLQRQQGVSLLQQSLLTPGPLETKLKTITDGIVRMFAADFCRIWLIRPGDLCARGCIHAEVQEGPHVCRHRERCLHLLASSGRYTHVDGPDHRRVPFGCYKIGNVASGQEHKFLTNDVQNDPRVHNPAWARELGLVSFAGYQLRVPGGDILGVLALFAKHPLSPAEDAMLDGLGSTVALVIQQAAAEAALRGSKEFLDKIINAIPDPVFVKDREHRLVLINDAEAALTGHPREEVLGRTDYEFFPKDQVEVFWRKDEEAFETGNEVVNEEQITDAQGELRTIVTKKTIYTDPADKKFIVGIVRDITDRQRAEEVLRRSEEELRLVTDNLTVLVAHLDKELRYRFANRPYLEWYALPREQVIGAHVRDVAGEESFRTIDPHLREALAGQLVRYEAQLRYRDGKTRWVDVTYVPEYDAAGQVAGLYVLVHDLTQRRQIEEAIRESEERFRTLVENTADGVGLAVDGKFAYVNPAACGILGRPAERLLGHSPGEFMTPESQARAEARMQDLLRGAAPRPTTYAFMRPDGSRCHVEIIANVIRRAGGPALLGVLRDVTAREQLQAEKTRLAEQLHRAQTIQAVGQVAVSIAHSFGNLLAAMRNGVKQLRSQPALSEDARSTLSAVSQAVEEAVSTTQSLLLFSRRLPAAHAPLDLGQLVGNAAKFLRHLLPAAIRVETHVPPDAAFWVSADAGQLRQVLLNLALNARDAMPSGGTLRISVSAPAETAPGRNEPSSVGGDPAVQLIIEDTGSGIPPEVRARIFEPFFTTKPAGEGTGLGLVTVQNIVRDHGGRIEVESKPGAGACFTIVLPALKQSALPEAQPRVAPTPAGGGQTVLLVVTDPYARRALISALRSWQYQVQEADDSDAAWEHVSAHPQDYALLLLEADPPARAGMECLRRVRAAGWTTPAILMTRTSLPKRERELDAHTSVLSRPFALSSLAELLATMLAEKPSAGGDP